MAEQSTPNYDFKYYDQYDIGWHTGINNNFINLDTYLQNTIKNYGHMNFIPHALFKIDSNADGLPDIWAVVDGTYIDSKVLQASEVMGFADKIVLTFSNSSGSTQYDGIKIAGILPPNLSLSFSAYIKSVTLNTKLRIKNGAANIDSSYAIHATAERVELAGVLDAAEATTDLIILVEIPDGTSGVTVEIHLPMLNVGDKAAAFSPALGEMLQFLMRGGLYFPGTMQSNLDVNQWQIKNARLDKRTSDPGSPVDGQIWFHVASGKWRYKYYDGTDNIYLAKTQPKWYISGALSVLTEVGGVFVAPQDLVVQKVIIYCKTTGSASSTIVDVHKGGTTIFTTQGNRPTLAYNDGDKKAEGTPDVTAIAEGDILTIDVDQIATGAEDLTVILVCK